MGWTSSTVWPTSVAYGSCPLAQRIDEFTVFWGKRFLEGITPALPEDSDSVPQPNENLGGLEDLFRPAVRDVDAHAGMRGRPEIPAF